MNSFYYALIEPRTASEDSRRHEFILNAILAFSLGPLAIVVSVSAHHLFFSCFFLVFAGLLWISRIGWVRLATHGLVLISIMIIAYVSFTWGANLQHALLGFVLVIAIAGALVDTAYSFIIAGTVSIITVILWDLQIRSVIQPDWFWQHPLQSRHAVDFVILFFTITCVLWLSNREIGKVLNRARHSEATLREELDSLEQKIEERTQEHKKDQLERLSQMYRLAKFGKLSSGIFHDLVNPLTAVALTIEDLKCHQSPQAQETKQQIDQALKATDRMKCLITAIVKQFQNPSAVNVIFSAEKEIEDVMAILAYKARAARVTLQKQIVEKDPCIFGNPLRYHQILSNIVANAIDACEDNAPNVQRCCSISLKKQPDSVLVLIVNSGPRIPEDSIGKIFDPFFTTKPVGRGNGIGLSIAKEITEKEFGGTISVESTDTWTAFTLLFPVKKLAITDIPLPVQEECLSRT